MKVKLGLQLFGLLMEYFGYHFVHHLVTLVAASKVHSLETIWRSIFKCHWVKELLVICFLGTFQIKMPVLDQATTSIRWGALYL